MKRVVEKQSEHEVLKEYPVQSEVQGWYFRIREMSNSAWLAEGTDLWGRKVSCQGSDEELLLRECVAMARDVAREGAGGSNANGQTGDAEY